MNLLPLLALLVQAGSVPQPIRVLFVGNSFTLRNDLPAVVAELGRALDQPVAIETGMAARDGMTLERHWERGDISRRLRTGRWDVLVLQEQSSRPLTDPRSTEAHVRRFAATARETGTQLILFQTWARADEPRARASRRGAVYQRLAASFEAKLAPVGDAWFMARQVVPAVGLYADDGLHASRAGTYLAAAVLLGVIAGRSPERARGLDSGDPECARALREVAWRALTATEGRGDGGSF